MKKPFVFICGCMLILTGVIGSVSGFHGLKKTTWSFIPGETFFVGGSGHGNFSKIQDAIDASSDGDTVFVYDDSSPYYENLIIEKSITLIGEDKETTRILGDESADFVIVNISADDVTVSGFTIQPNSGRPDGIGIVRNYTYPDYWNIGIIQNISVSDTIIKNTHSGIFGIRLNHAKFTGNIIDDCEGSGIMLYIPINSNISNNHITNSSYRGIHVDGLFSPFRILNVLHPVAANNIIFQNTIQSNRWGIGLYNGPVNTIIDRNNIIGNSEIGIDISQVSKTKVTNNNIIDNSINSFFNVVMVCRFPRFIYNSYDGNYWGEPEDVPLQINGNLVFSLFRYVEIGMSGSDFEFSTVYRLPWRAFDRHPAQEPYDIPGVR